jgi:hypothetical protein
MIIRAVPTTQESAKRSSCHILNADKAGKNVSNWESANTNEEIGLLHVLLRELFECS